MAIVDVSGRSLAQLFDFTGRTAAVTGGGRGERGADIWTEDCSTNPNVGSARQASTRMRIFAACDSAVNS